MNTLMFSYIIFEVIQCLLVVFDAVVLIKGWDYLKSNIIYILIKSTPLVLLSIYSTYKLMPNIALINFSSFITMSISTILLLRFSIIQGIIASIVSINALLVSQLFIYTLFRRFITSIYPLKPIALNIPIIIMQLIGLYYTSKYSVKDNIFFQVTWCKLSKRRKYTVAIFTSLLLLGLSFNTYYSSMYNRLVFSNVDYNDILLNVYFFFIQAIFISIIALIFFHRTIKYENYHIIFSSPNKAYKTILYNSSNSDIKRYLQILESSSRFVSIYDLGLHLRNNNKYLKTSFLNNISNIDSVNFKDEYLLFREIFIILNTFLKYNGLLIINLNDTCMEFSIHLVFSEFDKKRFLKLYNTNKIISEYINSQECSSKSFRLTCDDYINISTKEDILC